MKRSIARKRTEKRRWVRDVGEYGFDIHFMSFAGKPERGVFGDGCDRYIAKANGFMRLCAQAQGEAGWSHGFYFQKTRPCNFYCTGFLFYLR